MVERSPTILIIDDDIDFRTLSARALEKRGFTVVAAAGSPRVESLLDVHQPDLIVVGSDLMGAGDAGVIDVVRRRHTPRSLPILVVSGSDDPGEDAVESDDRVTACHPRGLPAEDLVATVEVLLGMRPATPRGDQG